MAAMPRPRLPNLVRQVTQHGQTVWFYRVGHGPRTRLRAPYGSEEFRLEYEVAKNGNAPVAPRKGRAGTLRWLWDRYRETQAWAKLSNATRRQRENIMAKALKSGGDDEFVKVTRKTIVAGRDRRASTPAMARHFVDTMRGMFEWALDAEHITVDPTHGVKTEKPQTDGHRPWTEEERERFRSFYPLGTRERLAFELIAHTGLRRGDFVRVGRQHVRKGVISLPTQKTGTVVDIPIGAELEQAIAASPTGDLTFFVGKKGLPMTKESFGNWFRDVCHDAGCPGRAHGIRKGLAEEVAERGATEKEMDAFFGWQGGGMASLYTKRANRKKLAAAASAKLLAEQPANNVFPHIEGSEGLKEKNAK